MISVTARVARAGGVRDYKTTLSLHIRLFVRLGRTLVITDVDSMHESWAGLLYGGHAARLVLVSRDAALGARLPPPRAARLAPLHFTARLEALTGDATAHDINDMNLCDKPYFTRPQPPISLVTFAPSFIKSRLYFIFFRSTCILRFTTTQPRSK